MKTFICAASITILLGYSIFAQTTTAVSQSKMTENILRVETEDGKTLELKTADLAKLPRREVKTRDHDGKEAIYEGVDLREVLQLAGIKFNKETERLNLTRYLLIEAADKYRVVFAFAEIDPAFTDKVILLAEKSDGKLLSEKNGHWQIIVPDEKKRGRWVRQVVALKILKPISERILM